ncbi:MAG: RAMP superfamily CRISPR-associated protein [Bosea sp. (in: a-proteobacteria)]
MSDDSLKYLAYKGRTKLSLQFETVAPLHIGTGFEDGLRALRKSEEAGTESEIVIGADDLPVIPSTTLKGALRALVERKYPILRNDWGREYPHPVVVELFGEIRDSEDRKKSGGAPGRLTIYAARMSKPPSVEKRIEPPARMRTKDGTYISARTAIDGEYGVAKEGLLFRQRMLAKGAGFTVDMVIAGGVGRLSGNAQDALLALLKQLLETGTPIGRNKGDGQGLLRLKKLVRREEIGPTEDADVANLTAAYEGQIGRAKALLHGDTRYRLTLTSEGPFIVKPLPEDLAKDRTPDKNDKKNTIKALRHGDGKPELPGTSLMGALRARAAWRLKLIAMRGAPEKLVDALHDLSPEPKLAQQLLLALVFGASADDLRAPEFRKALASALEINERKLTGYAGRLRVISISDAGPKKLSKLPSVKIDRFAMSPADGALFEIEAFARPAFSVLLDVVPARDTLDGIITDFVTHLLETLSADGPEGGLSLGSGEARGFGWFTAEWKVVS